MLADCPARFPRKFTLIYGDQEVHDMVHHIKKKKSFFQTIEKSLTLHHLYIYIHKCSKKKIVY